MKNLTPSSRLGNYRGRFKSRTLPPVLVTIQIITYLVVVYGRLADVPGQVDARALRVGRVRHVVERRLHHLELQLVLLETTRSFVSL